LVFRSRAEGALEVRQLAAAFMPHLIGIDRRNRAIKEGASKLAHSKGFAAGKNSAALGWILPVRARTVYTPMRLAPSPNTFRILW
jgi:hypothetical protein